MHSVRMSEVHTAKEWGLTPSEFRALSSSDQVEMTAYEIMQNKMAAYERFLASKKTDAITANYKNKSRFE